MTEKRFECYDLIFLDGYIKDTLTNEIIEEPIQLMNLLNELSHEVLVGDKLELFKQNRILDKHNNRLRQENKKLQERNNRQAKQLNDLYQLIEKKDWRALSDIMDDFQKAEEQLQSEWQTYEDKND